MNRYEFKGEKPLRTKKTGLVIARDFTRIVHGGRGAYVEIDNKDIPEYFFGNTIKLAPNVRHIYYDEYRTSDNTKLYFQRRTVKYADYKVGMWYVSPLDLEGFEVVGEYGARK